MSEIIRSDRLRKRIAKASSLFLILGLTGDLIAIHKTQFETAFLIKEAGDAKTSADTAARNASSAKQSAKDANDLAQEVNGKAATIASALKKTSGVLFLLQKLSESRHILDTKPLIDELKGIKGIEGKPVLVQSYAPDAWGHGLCESLLISVQSAGMNAVDMCGRIPYPTDKLVFNGIGVWGPNQDLAEKIGGSISRIGRLGVTSGLGQPGPFIILVGVQSPFWISEDWTLPNRSNIKGKPKKK